MNNKSKANDLINILENLLLTFVKVVYLKPSQLAGFLLYISLIFDFVTYSLYIFMKKGIVFRF
jgi:hypothetical protein